jgi:hypothetical protein
MMSVVDGVATWITVLAVAATRATTEGRNGALVALGIAEYSTPATTHLP